MDKDERERTQTRETINLIFEKVGDIKECFHGLDKKVGIMQMDIGHLKDQGCPVLNDHIKAVDLKVDKVDRKHDAYYKNIAVWLGSIKIFLWVLTSLGGLALIGKIVLEVLKKGG